jgi:homogentisate solanesyltransferase
MLKCVSTSAGTRVEAVRHAARGRLGWPCQACQWPAQATLGTVGRDLVSEKCRRSCKTHSSASSAAGEFSEEPSGAASMQSFLSAAWQFTRPHTIRGTLLGTVALTSKALLENSHLIDWGLLPRALWGLLALLCGNGYIVGINQIYDVDVDTVNKPFLPIAAGNLTPELAWGLCCGFASLGLALTWIHFDSLIAGLYALGLFVGTVYSVPPLRLKRFAVLACLCIATVRGLLLNFGVYYATRAALGLTFQWSPAVAFITAFVTLFAIAISITKDMPDVEGDRRYGVQTFATRLGVRKIAMAGTSVLLFNYISAIGLAIRFPAEFNSALMIGVHSLFAVVVIWRTVVLDRQQYSQVAIQEYYRWIWNLFYAEYFAFPFL